MFIPDQPRIYHILHVDRLPTVVSADRLWCDAEVIRREIGGATIGMTDIKRRRLEELTLASHPGLHVGACVPFYFCPRSIMLYLLHKGNHPELSYHGGQGAIVHLEADLNETVTWAESNGRRWAFTLSNAGARYFEDRSSLTRLHEISWDAVKARDWGGCKEGKQAEFLIEFEFPWNLVRRIGVCSQSVYSQACAALARASHRPIVEILPEWYY